MPRSQKVVAQYRANRRVAKTKGENGVARSHLEAVGKGYTTYFTGKPCPRGHVAKRSTQTQYCVECSRSATVVRFKKDPRKHLARARKNRGLPEPTRPEVDFCECCGRMEKGSLRLDHCHAVGNFRGWLCNNCNTGIGMLGDNLEGVLRAVEYLKKYG